MKPSLATFLGVCCWLAVGSLRGDEPQVQPPAAPAVNELFAFDNGVGRGRLSPDEQATMLADLGFAGIGYTGAAGIPEMLQALDRRQLKLFSIYVAAKVGPDGPSLDPGLASAIEALRGRGTVIWLTVQGGQASSTEFDDQAVRIVREAGALAEAAGLRVALYPHTGFYVARVEDAIRVVTQVDRPNVGVSFNLCHWLKLDDEANLETVLRAALPHLFLVSINGADGGDTRSLGWDRLIQTLDRGTYDVGRCLRLLRELGYAGPVGLQCYQIPGDERENLARSWQAWRRLTAAPAAAAAGFQFQETTDKTLTIVENGQPVMAYNHGVIINPDVPESDVRRQRACYVHPLWGLNGEVLTEDFPKDHYHHHGLYWAWPHVEIEGVEYDLWVGRGIQHRFAKWITREAGAEGAVLAAENGWFLGDRQVMRERVRFRVHPANAGAARAIDLDFVWVPEGTSVTLRGAPGKSYGGLNLRYAPREETAILVPAGRTSEDLLETPLPWADLTAKFRDAATRSGAALFVHPTHPDYPPTWLTRHYGVLCIGWPGVKAQTFEPGKPIRASYRVWIHRGEVTPEQLAQAYADYTAANHEPWE